VVYIYFDQNTEIHDRRSFFSNSVFFLYLKAIWTSNPKTIDELKGAITREVRQIPIENVLKMSLAGFPAG